MRVRWIVIRVITVAAAVAACGWLATGLGAWKALGVWTVVAGALCAAVAFLMQRQTPEKVTFVNYAAGVVLPWGYRIGRGKLVPIVVTSWAIWTLLGIAVAIAVVGRRGNASPEAVALGGERSRTVMILLLLSWLIDGAVLLRMIGVVATGTNRSHQLRSLAVPALVLVAMLASSIALVTMNPRPAAARTALLIAGGPPLLLGVAYAVFVVVMVTAGRNARWN